MARFAVSVALICRATAEEELASFVREFELGDGHVKCPFFLQPICAGYCMSKNCLPPLKECVADADCRSNMIKSMECMAMNGNDPDAPYYCFVPDNAKRDDFFGCIIDDHSCVAIKPEDPYPHCNESIVGDEELVEDRVFTGLWYKSFAWKRGEPIEWSPCNSVEWRNSSETGLTMITNWTAPDSRGHLWPVSTTTYTSAKPGERGTYLNVGRSYGLSLSEYHMFAHDGSGEAEPFVVDYICGSSLQGPYTTAIVLTKEPSVSKLLETKIASAVTQSLGLQWEEFVAVDNSCFEDASTLSV